ncbi:MAG TPA: UDP-N-acetylmuramoyl-L-alanine--D-glutamate ligase [Sphingomicrobium sp.]|nr:UDP-N-acetylmuramoyl-L-alanine--D-glutamate ligase [Sphingomicrobium sp.]
MITAKAFAGKHYAVYGLARSGIATVEALLASGARVTAWDDKLLPGEGRGPGQREPLLSSGLDPGLRRGTEITNLNEIDLSQFDSLVVTPGLPLNRHPIAQRARAARVEIIGDIELFARARPELPPHKVVGITGTNGKSTTTALVHHILKTAGVPTTMGGNIGLPILAQDPLPEGGVYVLELSSYQIDLTQSLDCDVAVLLNITPDHLDRYGSFEAYAASKARLFEMQSSGTWSLINADDPEADEYYVRIEELEWLGDRYKWTYPFGGESLEEFGFDQSKWPALQGPHNGQNAAAAIKTCEFLGIGRADIEEGLRTYPGLPHRMELIRERDGVLFVNDSKATNPTAAAPALAAFERIRWILGGQAKTDNLDECMAYFDHVRSAYTIGEAADLFERLLSPHIPVKNCGKLDVAVREAAADAQAGDTVLLSPACASFDQFRDFEDRGDQFRALVEGL